MIQFAKVESKRDVSNANYSTKLLAGDGWMHRLKKGQVLRLVDIEGNQGVDMLVYDADNIEDHYSATQTIVKQKNIYINAGTTLFSESGKGLLKLVADTCTCQDTLGGACAAQSNTVRYAHETIHMHNCRDTFMLQVSKESEKFSKAELVPNINLFAQILAYPDGKFEFEEGISEPGSYIEFLSLCNTVVLISNCPQMNNPCSGFNPTPLQLLIFDD